MPPRVGLSKSVKVEYGRPRHPSYRSVKIGLNKTRTQLEKEKASRNAMLSGQLSLQQACIILIGLCIALSYDARDELLDSGYVDSTDESSLYTLPPGEEGRNHSHDGDMLESIIAELGMLCV